MLLYRLFVWIRNLFYKPLIENLPLEYDTSDLPQVQQISIDITRELLAEIASWTNAQLASIGYICFEFELLRDDIVLLRELTARGLSAKQIITYGANLDQLKELEIAREFIVIPHSVGSVR